MSLKIPAGGRIYFLAICGTGMSALAGLFKERGYKVAGSDIAAYPPVGPLLKTLDIPVHLGFDVEDIERFKPDYVVIGNFIRRDNPQAQYVMEQSIPYGSFPSTLENFFLEQSQNYVVVGTHGKTTTTSCLAHLFAVAGQDPSFLVGGVPLNFNQSFRVGGGKPFVIEGDEYDTAFFDKESKFLHYRPTVGVFNSMEFDHADIFASVDAMELMFRKFVRLVDPKGLLLYCRDWERVHDLVQEEKGSGALKAKVQSYGFDSRSDFKIENFIDGPNGMEFVLMGQSFKSAMNGRFNAHNFAGALLAASWGGITLERLSQGLASFQGVKRRQEVVGEVNGHLVIDDFAHHPTAVDRVLEGITAKYPGYQVLTFFEPRSNTSRRNILQKEWNKAFDKSDVTFLAEVFRKEAIAESERLSEVEVVSSHASRGKTVLASLKPEEMISKAMDYARKRKSLFVVLSNGSFDGLHEKLISALKSL